MRHMSFCIESTRYCNYSKGKYNSELTFIIPSWMDLKEGSYNKCGYIPPSNYIALYNGVNIKLSKEYFNFLFTLENSEIGYLDAINKHNWKPQQAAKLLPQDTKADVIMTGFIHDYKHLFALRTSIFAETGQPDSEVSLLFDPLYNEFKNRGLI